VRDILVEAGPSLSEAILQTDYWAMRVDIQKAGTEKIETTFNDNIKMPFDKTNVELDDLMPYERS
jgi:hypothetical protein